MNVRLSRVHYPVTALGPGRRIGIWFQGCSLRCDACMAKDTWEIDAAQDTRVSDVVAWAGSRVRNDVSGITISGGEPFDQPDALAHLIRALRSDCLSEQQDVLVYSGYTERQLWRSHAEILRSMDALISGPFITWQSAYPSLRWRGSSNQVLSAFTDLGRRRYDKEKDSPSLGEMQVTLEDDRLVIIGVPRFGDLKRLEDLLFDDGVGLRGMSWQ